MGGGAFAIESRHKVDAAEAAEGPVDSAEGGEDREKHKTEMQTRKKRI